jgi:5-aminolevulinate synthase
MMRRHAIHIQPINYPTVDIDTERLRITPTPRRTEAHVAELWKLWQTSGALSGSSSSRRR